MRAIPKVQTNSREINQIQNNIVGQLNNIGNNSISSGIILNNQALKTGTNTINHKLEKPLTGWFIVRQKSLANIYDNPHNNKKPARNLILISNADVTVDIFVF